MTPQEYADLTASLAQIRATQDSLYRQLLGNGQPGRIQIIEKRLDDHSGRLKGLEDFKSQWLGKQQIVAAIAAAVMALAGQAIIHHWFG